MKRRALNPRSAVLLVVATVALGGCDDGASPRQPAATEAGTPSHEEPERNFTEESFYRAQDIYLSFDDPPLVPAEAARFLEPDDEVLGFVINGEARAYDVRALSYHHVINDHIGGAPVAVTY